MTEQQFWRKYLKYDLADLTGFMRTRFLFRTRDSILKSLTFVDDGRLFFSFRKKQK